MSEPPAPAPAPPRPAREPRRRPRRRLRLAVAPWRLFFNAVFDKEIRVAGRKLGTYAVRTAAVLVPLGIASLTFAGQWSIVDARSLGAVATLQASQTLAPAIALATLAALFGIVCLYSPSSTSASLGLERRQRTLPALLTSPLSAGQIVFGKLTAAGVSVAVLVLGALPIVLAVRVYGGLPVEPVLAAVGLTLATGALGAASGIWSSANVDRPSMASLAALFIFGVAMGGPPLALLSWNGLLEYASVDLAPRFPALRALPLDAAMIGQDVILASSPVSALVTVTAAAVSGVAFGTLGLIRPVYLGSIAWALTLSFFFACFATNSLRAAIRRESLGARPKRRRAKRGADAKTPASPAAAAASDAPADPAPDPAADPAPAPDAQPLPTESEEDARLVFRESRRMGDRPVLWRELRQPMLAKLKTKIAMALTAAVIYLVIYGPTFREYGASMNDGDIVGPAVIIAAIVVIVQAALTSAAGVCAEREAQTWETLLTTPLSPTAILVAKALGNLRRLWLVPAFIVLHLAFCIVFGRVAPLLLVHTAIILGGCVVMLAGTGVAAGMLFRRAAVAGAMNFVFAIVLWGGLILVVALLDAAMETYGNRRVEPLLNLLANLNPMYHLFSAVDAVVDSALPYETGTYELVGRAKELNADLATLWFLGVALLHASIGVAAVMLASWRFNRLVGRTS